MRSPAWLLLALVLAGAAASLDAPAAVVEDERVVARFVSLGDTGKGNAAQVRVAEAVRVVCAARGCDFATIQGDLIYDTGVSSALDPQFESKFERPYASVPLTFLLTMGNHDNSADWDGGAGTDSGKGDFEVAYHYRTDTSGKWFLPARYYGTRVGDLALFSLDTNSMMSHGVVRKGLDPVATAQAQDPASATQGAWLDDALAASAAPWKIVIGHHPLYSNGQHGNAGEYDGVPALGLGVKRFLEERVCGRADLYLAGHDHDLQWLQPREDACGATELVVSGAGSSARPLEDPDDNPAIYQLGDVEGFFWIELRETSFTAAVYDADATLRFEGTRAKPLP